MKQKVIGVYDIGYEQVQIVLREGSGGEFFYIPETGSLPRIKIGAKQSSWNDLVAVLLHEVLEFLMNRANCRFRPTHELSNDHSNYIFVLPHVTFSDVCFKAAECLAAVLPDLKREWKKWGK